MDGGTTERLTETREKDHMECVRTCMLVEHDPLTCREFCALLEQEESLRLVCQTGHMAEALEYLRVYPVDVLFLNFDETMEAELIGQIFACALSRPLVLVMAETEDEEMLQRLRMSGVDYIYRRSNPAFSVQRMIRIAKELCPYSRVTEEKEIGQTSDVFERMVIAQRLERMGFLRRYVSFSLVQDAVVGLLKAGDREVRITRDIYPRIAKKHRQSEISVERSLRSAIRSVFTGVPPEKMFRDYPFPYDHGRGYPTNAEFLNNLASWMREDVERFEENEEENGENP